MIDFLIKRLAAKQKSDLAIERSHASSSIELTKRDELLKFRERVLEEQKETIDRANEEKLRLAVEITKLEAEAVFKRQLVDAIADNTAKELEYSKKAFNEIIESKDKTIDDLKENIKVLIMKLPDVKLDGINVVLKQSEQQKQ